MLSQISVVKTKILASLHGSCRDKTKYVRLLGNMVCLGIDWSSTIAAGQQVERPTSGYRARRQWGL